MMPNAQRPMVPSERKPSQLSPRERDPEGLRPSELRIDRQRALLSRAAIFRGCSPAAIGDLAARAQLRSFTAGTLLVGQGEPGESMFLVAEGVARVSLFGESGREMTLAQLRPGEFFGEMSLLDDQPRSANVVAVVDVSVLVLTREAFAAHLRAHPQTAINLLAELTRRLRRADETIASLALHDVESRLCRTLERLAREDGEQNPGGLLLRRRPTQQELANLVGSCRETISRSFTSMVKRGLLVPRGRGVLLTPALLERKLSDAA